MTFSYVRYKSQPKSRRRWALFWPIEESIQLRNKSVWTPFLCEILAALCCHQVTFFRAIFSFWFKKWFSSNQIEPLYSSKDRKIARWLILSEISRFYIRHMQTPTIIQIPSYGFANWIYFRYWGRIFNFWILSRRRNKFFKQYRIFWFRICSFFTRFWQKPFLSRILKFWKRNQDELPPVDHGSVLKNWSSPHFVGRKILISSS